MAFNLYPTHDVANIFGNWWRGINHKFGTLTRVKMVSAIRSLCVYRNDMVLNGKNSCRKSFTGVPIALYVMLFYTT
jgi:hypothetical protein